MWVGNSKARRGVSRAQLGRGGLVTVGHHFHAARRDRNERRAHARDGRRGVDTLVVDRGGATSVVLHKLPGFHSHCDRSLFGPLRHLVSNVPRVPAGPLNYDDDNGDFEEWLQTTNQPLKVRNARGLLDRVYVCHGIFSTHLGPICDALGIERPPPADLAKRKISQGDIRAFVEAARKLFRAAGSLLVFATALRVAAAGLEKVVA